MKSLLLTLALTSLAHAVTTQPNLTALSDSTTWRIHNRAATPVPEKPNALRLDVGNNAGVAWLVGSDFSNGTLELDLRGANKPGQSFVGLAFHGADDATYEAVYFRPFNFRQPDAIRRSRAVQYISLPGHDWPTLREQHPGKYEAPVSPVPNPDDWFHARIVIENRTVSVFVNDASDPCLVVESLSDRSTGQIGLWVGNGSSGDFANLKLTPAP